MLSRINDAGHRAYCLLREVRNHTWRVVIVVFVVALLAAAVVVVLVVVANGLDEGGDDGSAACNGMPHLCKRRVDEVRSIFSV